MCKRPISRILADSWGIRLTGAHLCGMLLEREACKNERQGEYMNDKPNATPIIIRITGGIAELESAPSGTEVIFRDYDVDGADPEDLVDDGSGNLCFEKTEIEP